MGSLSSGVSYPSRRRRALACSAPLSIGLSMGSGRLSMARVLPARLSPDARQLLYLAQAKANFDEISTGWYIVPLAGGQAFVSAPPRTRSTYSGMGLIDEAPVPLAWLRGNRILYRASSGDAINLWLATLSARNWRLTKPPDQLTFGSGEITSASVSESGTVVFGNTSAQARLWSFALERGKGTPERELAALPSSGDRRLLLAFRYRKARLPITKIRELERLAERSIERETDLARECQGKLLER
jgi:hypothetical protein